MNQDQRINMALNHLAAFEMAVDTGSFTKAAKMMGTTQPSISRHILALEYLLDVSLFDRLHHRVELTEAGSEFYDAVKLGLGHIRQAAGTIAGQNSPNVVSIGCTYGFAHLWLMPRFSALQKLFPEYEMRMVTSDTRTLFDLQEVDFALRFGKGDWGDGGSKKLFSEELFPVCSPQFSKEHFGGVSKITASAVSLVPLIQERREKFSWLSWQQWLTRHGVDFVVKDDTYFYDNYALTLQAAIEGQGVALAWQHLAEPPLNSGQLVEIEGLRVKTECGYYLAYRHNHPMSAKISNWFKSMARLQETRIVD